MIASDGLPAREVHFHTREKFDRHGKYCSTFNNAMWAGLTACDQPVNPVELERSSARLAILKQTREEGFGRDKPYCCR